MLTYFVVISSLRTSIYGSADSTIDPYAGDGIPSVQWCIPAKAVLSAICSAYLAQLLRGTSWSLVFCMEELGNQPS